MQVDVVIPAYNSAAWLEDAVRSVLEQSKPAARVIVVDDGSTDGTDAVLRRFADRVLVVRHAANRGLPAARNSGIRAGGSELVAFLDADDVWAKDKLQKQLTEFEGTDPPGLSYTGVVDCDMLLRPLGRPRRFKRREREHVFEELFVDAFPIPPSTAIVRRSVFDSCGLFDESMLKAQDYEFWLRVAMKFTVSCLPEPLCYRRVNPNSITARSGHEKDLHYSYRAFELCAKAAAQAGTRLPMTVAERKILFLRRRYRECLRWGDRIGEEFFRRRMLEAGAFSAVDSVLAAAARYAHAIKRVARAGWIRRAAADR